MPAERTRVEEEVQTNERTEDVNWTRDEWDRVRKNLGQNSRRREIVEDTGRGLPQESREEIKCLRREY